VLRSNDVSKAYWSKSREQHQKGAPLGPQLISLKGLSIYRSSIVSIAGGHHSINTPVGSNRRPQLPIAGAACWCRISEETPFRQCWRCDNAGNVLCRLHRPCGAHAAGGRSGCSFQLWLMQGGLGKERTLAGKSGPTCASSCRRGSLAARRVYSM
jgi:hypothetical protein